VRLAIVIPGTVLCIAAWLSCAPPSCARFWDAGKNLPAAESSIESVNIIECYENSSIIAVCSPTLANDDNKVN
jgi:hypothetical protein